MFARRACGSGGDRAAPQPGALWNNEPGMREQSTQEHDFKHFKRHF
jgi:hypothetical protein